MTDLLVRSALLEDSEAILSWRNDQVSRSFSIDSGIISREEHELWYRKCMELSDSYLIIGHVAGERVGVVRYDPLKTEGEFEVSINLNPDWRNRGLGTRLLEDSLPVVAKGLDYKRLKLLAKIKLGNNASVRTFERAGYTRRDLLSEEGLGIFTCSWPEFDAVICLSNAFNEDLQLSREYMRRLDLSSQLFRLYGTEKLVTLGWAYHVNSPVSLAQAAADYLRNQHKIAANDIHTDDRPKDTVGEAMYIAQDCLTLYQWRSVALVTSDWHLPRAKHIFAHIFGARCKLFWFTTDGDESLKEVEKLNRSRRLFDTMVANISPGNIDALCAVIKQQHPLYEYDD